MAIVKGAGMVMKAVIEVRHRSGLYNCTLEYNYKTEHKYNYSNFKSGMFPETFLFLWVLHVHVGREGCSWDEKGI